MEFYNYPIALTSQFRFCGNPFRVDTYSGCNYGCKYCFSLYQNGGANRRFDGKQIYKIMDINKVTRMFERAFANKSNSLTSNLLRRKVPLHLGGLADPFPYYENKERITYKFLQLTNSFQYPVIISTKCGELPDEYFDILNPEIHAFQISLISNNDKFIRQFEINTPTVTNRISFIKKLRSKGFWTGVRIQPLIDINEAVNLVKEIDKYINYITIEHLKISIDNKEMIKNFKWFLEKNRFKYKRMFMKFITLLGSEKKKNVEKIKSIADTPVGCGDNDLHCLTDSRCCCGIDTINDNFKNWLKYNETYFRTGNYGLNDIWYPKADCGIRCINPDTRFNYPGNQKDYTDDYMRKMGYIIQNNKFVKEQYELF